MQENSNIIFLPLSNKKLSTVDVLLVTGDLYIDHPSFGIAIIARLLESLGLTVCIVSTPPYYDKEFLKTVPDVKLFVGITAGNLDSMVANYSSQRVERKVNEYNIDNEVHFPNGLKKRPDLATIVYTSYFKSRYKVPIILGGIEASLRRFVHYDFVTQNLRRSILTDSKADLIIYSMGEKALTETVDRLKSGESLIGIDGTAIKMNGKSLENIESIKLPSFKEIQNDRELLIKTTSILEENFTFKSDKILAQEQNDNNFVVVYPPQKPLTTEELDRVYALPFKKDFPAYVDRIKAFEMIKNSVTSHRGCYGGCSFCAIGLHQGKIITSRSKNSIVDEVKKLTKQNYFRGTVSDIGGPTANMYGSKCKTHGCKKVSCLYPSICENLILDEKSYMELLTEAKNIAGVKNLFVSSGIRHDIALIKKLETEKIIIEHTSGRLKIAPEHIDERILSLMRKPSNKTLIDFINFFNDIKNRNGLNFYIASYIILSFPGSSDNSVKRLEQFLTKYNIKTKHYQDFTPTPMTMATAMFYAKKDLNSNDIKVVAPSVRNRERRILERED